MTLTTLALITSSMAFDANQPMQVESLSHSGGVIIVPPKKPKTKKLSLSHSGGVIIVPPEKPKTKD